MHLISFQKFISDYCRDCERASEFEWEKGTDTPMRRWFSGLEGRGGWMWGRNDGRMNAEWRNARVQDAEWRRSALCTQVLRWAVDCERAHHILWHGHRCRAGTEVHYYAIQQSFVSFFNLYFFFRNFAMFSPPSLVSHKISHFLKFLSALYITCCRTGHSNGELKYEVWGDSCNKISRENPRNLVTNRLLPENMVTSFLLAKNS